MSVMPGFGGQEFEPVALEKLHRLHGARRRPRAAFGQRRRQYGHRVGLHRAGAADFVTGSALFSRMITADSSARWADWHGRHGARRPWDALTFQL